MEKNTRRGRAELPFKAKLQEVMEKRGLSQAQIAALAGVSKTVVHDWTAGSTPHDLQAVGRLAKALGCSLRELLLGEEESEALPILQALLPQTGSKDDPDEAFDEESIIQGVYKISISRLRSKFQK
jgi:transcriptional regulator with XRE-family HTH domain